MGRASIGEVLVARLPRKACPSIGSTIPSLREGIATIPPPWMGAASHTAWLARRGAGMNIWRGERDSVTFGLTGERARQPLA